MQVDVERLTSTVPIGAALRDLPAGSWRSKAEKWAA